VARPRSGSCAPPCRLGGSDVYLSALLWPLSRIALRCAALVAPLVFAFTSLVAGETCPAPVDVEARVRAILHLAVEQQLSEGFVVERRESGLYVELRSADSTLIGQRTLPVEGSCDELAQAAAVVLSAWLNDAHPDFAGALPPTTPPGPEPAPPPEPVAVPKPAPAPVAAPALDAAPSRRFELGLGVGADLSGESFVPTAFVVGGFVPVAGGFGVSGVLGASSSRELSLGPGRVAWRRWPFGLGPSYRAATSRVSFEANVGPALAWLHLDGSNFAQSSTQNGVEPGAFLQLRADSRGSRWGVFGLANAQYYPLDSGASASSPDERWFAPVPRFSVGLAVGAWLLP
jgi:hypothetical protein